MEGNMRIACRWVRRVAGAIILTVLFSTVLSALDPDIPAVQYLVDKWDVSEGIPSNTIISITQTPDGYLWIATEKGLVRFDGIKFSPVQFTENTGDDPEKVTIPEALFVDKEGTLWIGSTAGLTSYRYQNRRFHTFTTADGLTGDSFRRIKEDMRGNLWISFAAGYVNRFFNGKFTAFNESHGLERKKINDIVEAPNGNLFFGSREVGDGVFIFNGGRFSKYSIDGLNSHEVLAMHWDLKRDELWIGTDKGLFRVTGKVTRIYTVENGLSNNYITAVVEDKDRNLWVGSAKGLNRIKRKENGSVTIERVLKSFTIDYIFEDSEDSLWIGTYKSGIRRLKEGKFVSYAPLDNRPDELLFSLYEDERGDTWIGAFDGKLFRCRGDDILQVLRVPGLSGSCILSIAEDARGHLWLGTNGNGAFLKKDDAFIPFTTENGISDNLVTSMFKDSRGDIWLCTFDGVSLVRKDEYEKNDDVTIRSLNSRNGLLGKKTHNVYEDKKKDIWIASDKGITVLPGGNFEKKNMIYYLEGIPITCIYEDSSPPGAESKRSPENHVFWIATYGDGLKRLVLKNRAVVSTVTFAADQGMASNYLYRFFEDKPGNFWIMSNRGILRVGKNDMNRFADYREEIIHCTSFGVADGLKSLEFDNQFSRNSALKTRNGSFLFVTKKGISVLNPAKVHINKRPPPVIIESVTLDYRSVPVEFHFTAPTFLSPEKVNFKYKLDGFDKEWKSLPPGSERVTRYPDPGPGTHTFHVTACNSEGVWNRTGASMTFTVKPLFYQTFFFKIIILFLFVGIFAVGFYILKKRPFEKKMKHRGLTPNRQFVDECIKKLTYLMEVEHLYRESEMSLPLLAEKLSVSPHLLSQVLNERLNRGFSDFINSYRIEEAKSIFHEPGGEKAKVELVAFDVGFNTVMAFYNAFKKFTGMTPARYKKKFKNKK
jgi:ligand-binding sensor domain-containing protein/AraC-like DNA-binding protein